MENFIIKKTADVYQRLIHVGFIIRCFVFVMVFGKLLYD